MERRLIFFGTQDDTVSKYQAESIAFITGIPEPKRSARRFAGEVSANRAQEISQQRIDRRVLDR